jgi:hypothetical protein
VYRLFDLKAAEIKLLQREVEHRPQWPAAYVVTTIWASTLFAQLIGHHRDSVVDSDHLANRRASSTAPKRYRANGLE